MHQQPLICHIERTGAFYVVCSMSFMSCFTIPEVCQYVKSLLFSYYKKLVKQKQQYMQHESFFLDTKSSFKDGITAAGRWRRAYFLLKSILQNGNVIFWSMLLRWAHWPIVPELKLSYTKYHTKAKQNLKNQDKAKSWLKWMWIFFLKVRCCQTCI